MTDQEIEDHPQYIRGMNMLTEFDDVSKMTVMWNVFGSVGRWSDAPSIEMMAGIPWNFGLS